MRLDRFREEARGSMAVELPASDEEKAARDVIELAGAALARRRGDIPGTFVAQLLGRDAGQQVGRDLEEALLESRRARVGTAGLVGQGAAVGRRDRRARLP